MANEIQVGHGSGSGSTFDLLFYYPIPAGQRIKARDSAGAQTAANVVWTPSASAPSWAKFTAQETSDLDAGNSVFRTETMAQGSGESDAAFLARIQQRYADLSTSLLAAYQTRYRHLNRRFNAV